MKLFMSSVIVLGLGAGVFFGWRAWAEQSSRSAAAHAETARQSAELATCEARLAKLHKAWSAYRASHKGANPPTVEALLDGGVAPSDLLCPTAARWIEAGGAIEQGFVRSKGKNYPETYGFKWLAAGYERLTKGEGDEAPLIVCSAHREVTYRAVYHKPPPLGAFDTAALKNLPREVAGAPILVARKSGAIDTLTNVAAP